MITGRVNEPLASPKSKTFLTKLLPKLHAIKCCFIVTKDIFNLITLLLYQRNIYYKIVK